jgi:hypothetical protein
VLALVAGGYAVTAVGYGYLVRHPTRIPRPQQAGS